MRIKLPNDHEYGLYKNSTARPITCSVQLSILHVPKEDFRLRLVVGGARMGLQQACGGKDVVTIYRYEPNYFGAVEIPPGLSLSVMMIHSYASEVDLSIEITLCP